MFIDPMIWDDDVGPSLFDPMEWDHVEEAPTTPELEASSASGSFNIPTEKTATSELHLIDPMVWNGADNQSKPCPQSSTPTLVSNSTTATKPTAEDKKAIVGSDFNEKELPYDIAQKFLERMHIKIVDEIIYYYESPIYHKISKEVLKRLIVNEFRAKIKKAGNAGLVDSIYKCIMTEPEICITHEQSSQDIIVFEDGILHLDSWSFEPYHSTKYFVTSYLKVSYLHGKHPLPST